MKTTVYGVYPHLAAVGLALQYSQGDGQNVGEANDDWVSPPPLKKSPDSFCIALQSQDAVHVLT